MRRLFADAVARQRQRTVAAVPDGKAEHPAQPLDAALALFFVEVNDGLGVAPRREPVAARDQLITQFPVVVDFAVEDDPHRAVFVGDRLTASGHVDD
jgi:hypothetical protein